MAIRTGRAALGFGGEAFDPVLALLGVSALAAEIIGEQPLAAGRARLKLLAVERQVPVRGLQCAE